MSRPLKEENTGHPRQVRLDCDTFAKLLVVRNMMMEEIGLDRLHMNQVISIMLNNHVKIKRKEVSK
jgi:hypothetical protein